MEQCDLSIALMNSYSLMFIVWKRGHIHGRSICAKSEFIGTIFDLVKIRYFVWTVRCGIKPVAELSCKHYHLIEILHLCRRALEFPRVNDVIGSVFQTCLFIWSGCTCPVLSDSRFKCFIQWVADIS